MKEPKDYPVSAEQYLIANYENTLRENRQLVIENKSLKGKLKFYEETKPEVLNDESSTLASNQIKALPILEVTHSTSSEYDYKDYGLNPERYEKLVAYLEEIKTDPSKTLKGKYYYITKHPLNVRLELFGLVKYAHAYTHYNDNSNLQLNLHDEIIDFDTAYQKVLKDVKDNINGWEMKYKQKYEEKQTPKENVENV